MKTNRYTKLSFIASLVFMSSWTMAEPQLNGLAVSTELNKERFIAALYSDNVSSDADTILNSSGERAMELKITDRRLSARSLNSMWIEGIAINNRGPELEAQAENLASLTNMIRKRLVTGDTLRFDASAGNGTTVTLNGIKLGNIASDDFFPMLLKTWIGRVPLSSDFKAALLGAGSVDGDLRTRYNSISPDPARIELVSSWSPSAPPAPVASNNKVAPPPPPVSVRPPAPTLRPSELAKPTIAAIKKQDPPQAAIAAKPAPASTTAPSSKVPKPTEPPKAVEVASTKPAPTPKPPSPPISNDEEEDEEEEVAFSASGLLERQYYVSNSMISIQKSVSYPRRAIERRQEGSVRLAVTVDREGKLQNLVTVEESNHGLLNRAAAKAVEDADLGKLPNSIGGDSFTFTVPITFKVN